MFRADPKLCERSSETACLTLRLNMKTITANTQTKRMKKTTNKAIESGNLSLLTLATRRLGLWIALGATFLLAAAQADVVTDWNQITLATQATVLGGVRTPPAARALAMVHLGIFDSVNAIDRRFTPYAVQALADPAASAEAAAAAAA